MKTVYLAWRDLSERWYPVGELTHEGDGYRFRYLRGSEDAGRTGGFRPLVAFPEFGQEYHSLTLFPTFENRIPAPSRPDYVAYMEWLALPATEPDPLDLLARSGGHRATDRFEVFARPEPTPDGRYVTHVFAQGLQHVPDSAKARALALVAGEELELVPEPTNQVDPFALTTHTADYVQVGYAPCYLAADLAQRRDVRVVVERVNPPPVPIQFRLLCRIEAPWSAGLQPCSGRVFEPRAVPASAGL